MKFTAMTDPAVTPDAEFEYLDLQLKSGITKVFSVELPDECIPDTARLSFCIKDDEYVVRFMEPVAYLGEDQAFLELCAEQEKRFDSLDEMKSYLRSIQLEKKSRTEPQKEKRKHLPDKMPDTVREEIKLAEPSARSARKISPQKLFEDVTKIVRGQEKAISRIVRYACASAAKTEPLRPYSIMIAGGTGQGKTLLGKTLALAMNEQIRDRDKHYGTVIVHCNELAENHDVSRLTGASPNYVGYGDENLLSPVLENPYQVVIFDEIEKAAPRVLDVLMTVLDCGEIMLAKPVDGKSVLDMKHCLLLFTANVRLERPKPKPPIGFEQTPVQPEEKKEEDLSTVYRNVLVAQGLRREIAARFTDIVCFEPLKEDTVIDIILQSIQNCASEYGFRIGFVSPEIIQAVYDRVDAAGFGARMVNRIVSEKFDLFFAESDAAGSGQNFELTGSCEEPVLKTAADRQ